MLLHQCRYLMVHVLRSMLVLSHHGIQLHLYLISLLINLMLQELGKYGFFISVRFFLNLKYLLEFSHLIFDLIGFELMTNILILMFWRIWYCTWLMPLQIICLIIRRRYLINQILALCRVYLLWLVVYISH